MAMLSNDFLRAVIVRDITDDAATMIVSRAAVAEWRVHGGRGECWRGSRFILDDHVQTNKVLSHNALCRRACGSSRRRSNRYYRSPATDVIRDQIEIVREIRRLMLNMQASDAA
jgi:hypothetical protein